MKSRITLALLGLFLLFVPSITRSAFVFWDMEGVTAKVNKNASFRKMGRFDVLCQLFLFKIGHPTDDFKKTMQNLLFQTLTQMPDNRDNNGLNDNIVIYSNDGVTPLPAPLTRLMLGIDTYKTVKEQLDSWIQNGNFPLKGRKKRLFLNMFGLAFNPESLVSVLELNKKICQLLKESADAGNINIILSNLGSEAVEPFTKKFDKEIMQYMDEAIFSGNLKNMAKPNTKIYEYSKQFALKNFSKHPDKRMFFIDDLLQNTEAAAKCGIISTHPDLARKMLSEHDVIASS